MDSSSQPHQTMSSANCIPENGVIPSSNGVITFKKNKKIKKHKHPSLESSHQNSIPESCLSSSTVSSCSTTSHSALKVGGFNVSNRYRNPRRAYVRPNQNDVVGAIALPTGMAIAAVLSQVLEQKHSTEDMMSVDHLSKIFTSAVGESLANVFGDKYDCFANNFEKSFRSTLMTLRLVNKSSHNDKAEDFQDSRTKMYCAGLISGTSLNRERSSICHPHEAYSRAETVLNTNIQKELSTLEAKEVNMQPNQINHALSPRDGNVNSDPASSAILDEEGSSTCYARENYCRAETVLDSSDNHEELNTSEDNDINMQPSQMNRALSLHGGLINQQLTYSSNTLPSFVNGAIHNTLERSIIEQSRSNDLKTFEIGLIMKKMQLKEAQLALNSDSNSLERFKLSMGVSKASFKAEKFKTELKDARHAELLKTCIDCLVAGLFIMLAALAYGTYVYSHQRIIEATASCAPTPESKSWWIPKPMSSISSGLHTLRCQVQVVFRMLFGVLMILSIAYLLLQRAGSSKQAMPVTFILLLLGGACGFAGKYCIDTLGGSGNHWLFYWEILCLLHFFSNICTPYLFIILNGPINVTERSRSSRICPLWIRRCLFYSTTLLVLPLMCGFMPFAGPAEWINHFCSLVLDHFQTENWDARMGLGEL